MSGATAATAEQTARLQPAHDSRLVPYCIIAVGGMAAALLTGQAGLAVLAAPFALALGLGLRRLSPVEVKARLTLGPSQVLEGDDVAGRVELEWDGPFVPQVMLARLNGVAPLPDAPLAWSLEPGSGQAELPVALRAVQWGRHTALEVWVRLEEPFGLLSWTGRVAAGPTLRVLPGTEMLTRLLEPLQSRAVLGAHRSKRLGAGGEFAELRPYVPGDRLRDLNWRASTRHRRPFVNHRHPELAGDVVIAIDAYVDGSIDSAQSLGRAARAAWALASVHLRMNDRVGLGGIGGSTRWLAPAGGRLAQYQLLETLLQIGGEAVDPAAAWSAHHRLALPPAALIIVLTPLHDAETVATIERWRARGRSVAVVVIDTLDQPDEPDLVADALARRVWLVELARRTRELTGLGIPVVTAPRDGPMTPVISALRRARQAPSVRRAR